jgi:hypothetical protein
MHRNIITDGSTRKLENLIVTTVPYHCSRQEKSIWLDRGSTIRNQTGMPWIVLHQVPAKTGSGVSRRRSLSLAKIKEMAADQETLALPKRFSGNPDVKRRGGKVLGKWSFF